MPSNTASLRPQAKSFSRLFEIALVVFVMGIYLFAALSEGHNFAGQWFIRDDAFYYFKVAQNITEGRGVTFDGINPTNGYHPLWMLVCIPIFALARFDLILPLRVLVIVSGGISAATGILLFRLVKRTLSAPAAVFAASYWVFDRAIHYNVTMFGLETGLTALTMTAFLLEISRLSSLRGAGKSPTLKANTVGDEAIPSPPPSLRGANTLTTLSAGSVSDEAIPSPPPSLRGASGTSDEAISSPARGLLRRENRPPRNDGGIVLLALLAVAMTFSRLDTVFLALLAGAWILLRGAPLRTRLMLDAGIIVSAAFVSVAMRTGLPDYFVYTQSAVIFAAAGLVIQIPVFFLFGLYQNTPLLLRGKHWILRFVAASLLGAGIVALVMIGLLVSGALSGLPRSALLLYAGIVTVGAGVVRWAARTAARRPAKVQVNWRQVFGEGVCYYGILGGALAAYMLYNKIAFGTFMPISGQIKAWWGSLQGSTYGNPISTLTGFLGLERDEGLNAWGPVVYLLHDLKDRLGLNLWLVIGLLAALVVSILLTRKQRAARAAISLGLPLLLTGSLAQLFYYNGQGYAGAKDWYWVSQMLLIPLLGALLFDLILRPLRRLPSPRGGGVTIWLITVALCLGYYALPFGFIVIQRMPWGAERADQPYLDALPFLESNTEEGALIGMTGGGNIGYFIEGRVIVNMDGLINSYAYFQSLRAGRADEYLANIGLDYIFSNPDILQNPPYNGQFNEWSLKVAEFGKKDLLRMQSK